MLQSITEAEKEREHWESCMKARDAIDETSAGITEIAQRLQEDLVHWRQPEQRSSGPSMMQKCRTMAQLAAFPPTFRYVHPSEFARLRQIESTCRAYGTWPLTVQQLAEYAEAEPCLLLGAYLGEDMVGFIRGEIEAGGVVQLRMFGIDTPFRGCQLGLQLLRAFVFHLQVLALLHPQRIRSVAVTVPGGLARLLCKVGFQGVGEQRVETVDRVTALLTGAQDPDIDLELTVVPARPPLLSFGVVANARLDDAGMGVEGDGISVFHHTPLRKMTEIIRTWRDIQNEPGPDLSLLIHIGDPVEQTHTPQQTLQDLPDFQRTFEPVMPITLAHVIGPTLLRAGLERVKPMLLMKPEQTAWYELKPAADEVLDDEPTWRCLVVDVYDGCQGQCELAFSQEQKVWLIKKLQHAERLGHAVLIAMHRAAIVVDAVSAKQSSAEAKRVMAQLRDIFGQFRFTIRCVICGDESGEFHRNIDGINYLGIASMVSPEEEIGPQGPTTACNDIHLFREGIVVHGRGRSQALRLIPYTRDTV